MGRARSQTTDAFAGVFGSGRGRPATDAESAKPTTDWSCYFDGPTASKTWTFPRTCGEIAAALAQFPEDLPLYIQDINDDHTLEGAMRLTGYRKSKLGNGEIHIEPEFGPGPAKYETVGEFCAMLAAEDADDKVWFQPPRPALSETLVSYMLFENGAGKQFLALITVH
jgi:hypothetical protein